MKTTTARWTIALAAATIFAMPASGLAQQTPPPSQPPSASQPATAPAQTPQPPAPESSASSDVAKTHLTNARNALSQITQLPAAAQLQGDARAQVSQLINNFNELITTQSDWKSSYAKVESNLNALLAPQPQPAPQAAPNAAAAPAAGAEIDPSIRAKLVEFKGHLAKFEQAAGVATTEAQPAAPAQTPPDPTTPTQTAPPTQANPPANQPTSQTPPTTETPPPTQPPTDPTPAAARPDPEPDQPPAADPQEILAHIDAIEAILSGQATAQSAPRATAGGAAGTAVGTTGTTRAPATPGDVMLTRAQLEDLHTHLAELRRLLERK
jgi:hypothetical protein